MSIPLSGDGDFVRVGGAPARMVVIPDAELLLPDDTLPMSRGYEVYSSYIGGRYQSLPRIINRRKAVEAELLAESAQWQRDIKPEAFVLMRRAFAIDTGAMVVVAYGHLPDPYEFVAAEAAEKAKGGATSDVEKFARRLHRRIVRAVAHGWLYGQWFSEMSPQGEWGSIHCAHLVAAGDRAWFEEAQERGWKPPEGLIAPGIEESGPAAVVGEQGAAESQAKEGGYLTVSDESIARGEVPLVPPPGITTNDDDDDDEDEE